ncbi:MAG: carbon starvation CstA family protein [Planctomycetota bacterium]|jgi:carbon starvation protein
MEKLYYNILTVLTLAGAVFFSNGCAPIEEKAPSARIIELHQQTIAKHARQIIALEYETKKLADSDRIQQSAMASLEAKIEEQMSQLTVIEYKQQELLKKVEQLNQSIDNMEAGLEEIKKIQSHEQRLEKIEKEAAFLKASLSVDVQLKHSSLEFPAGKTKQTVVTIIPETIFSAVSFEVEDPAIASVKPAVAAAAQQKITVKGLKQGLTRLIVRLENRQLAEIKISILSAVAESAETSKPAAIAKKPKSKRPFNTLILMLVCGVGYLLAYHTYGRFLARKIFKIVKDAPVPSKELEDGIDYVPAKKGIIFGHHYTSIAGTGPIVGPAIGVIWGWLPAILWVVFGAIFMGAVHDLGALIVSLRNEGKSISEIAAKYINKRVRFIFFAIVFLSLLIVIAIFGVVIATVFDSFPTSVIPVWFQIPIAVTLGYLVYKKSANIPLATTVAVAGMYLCIYLGSLIPVKIGSLFGLPPTGLWTIILLVYAWIASTLPVTTLLQPRDYINAWQLFIAMGLLVLGTVTASFSGNLPLVAPAINTSLPENTPPVWPFLFVTIACGAISGFHSLVASGTTAKQVEKETDAHFVGYGSMLLEGFLAVLIIICVTAGIGMALKLSDGTLISGSDAWQHFYGSWIGDKGLPDKLAPVVKGAANMMGTFGLPEAFGITLMGVFIASFAGTTLDTSTRIQRYVVSELANDLHLSFLANRWAATTLAVMTAAALAFMTKADGKGAMTLWPLFGTANQLLASLALLVVTFYLKHKGGIKYLLTAIPCIVMLVITTWAMIQNQIRFIAGEKWHLVVIGMGIILLALWMIIEALITFRTVGTKQ